MLNHQCRLLSDRIVSFLPLSAFGPYSHFVVGPNLAILQRALLRPSSAVSSVLMDQTIHKKDKWLDIIRNRIPRKTLK